MEKVFFFDSSANWDIGNGFFVTNPACAAAEMHEQTDKNETWQNHLIQWIIQKEKKLFRKVLSIMKRTPNLSHMCTGFIHSFWLLYNLLLFFRKWISPRKFISCILVTVLVHSMQAFRIFVYDFGYTVAQIQAPPVESRNRQTINQTEMTLRWKVEIENNLQSKNVICDSCFVQILQLYSICCRSYILCELSVSNTNE